MPLVPTYSSGFSFFLTIALSGSWISNYKRGKNANPPGFKPVLTGAKTSTYSTDLLRTIFKLRGMYRIGTDGTV